MISRKIATFLMIMFFAGTILSAVANAGNDGGGGGEKGGTTTGNGGPGSKTGPKN